MLELGKARRGELPVLRDGEVEATLRASNWKERATAVIGSEEWIFARAGREHVARRAEDPEASARFRAQGLSSWRSGEVDLAGTPVQISIGSWWRTTHRYSVGDRVVAEGGTVGAWAPRPTLTDDGSLPLLQLVFLLWLEMVVRRRAAAAAAA